VAIRLIPRWSAEGWQAAFTLLGVLVASAGGFFAYGQWQNDKVLELQSRWGSDEMQTRRNRITDGFVCMGVPYVMLGMKEEELKQLRLQIVSPSKDYDGVAGDVAAYLDFFEDVRTCVDTRVCNAEVACKRFGPEAAWLSKVLGPYVERQRLLFREADYGTSFDGLKNSCKPWWKEIEAQPMSLSQDDKQRIADIHTELQPEEQGLAHYQRKAACDRMRPSTAPTVKVVK